MARQLGLFFAGLFALALVVELALRVLPVSTATLTGYHHDANVITYPSGHEWRVATGWDLRNAQRLKANNWGFVADRDFGPDKRAIALIGDSYVEASMLPAESRPGAQLQRLLTENRKVYAMGGPGSALLDYAERIRLASDEFGIRDFVLLLERYDARQSLCGSGNVHAPCLDPTTLAPRVERRPPSGLANQLFRHSALAQYVSGQIRFRPAALWRAMWTRTVPEEPADSPRLGTASFSEQDVADMKRRVDAVVEVFWVRASVHATGRLVMVIDGRRDGAAAAPDLADLERAHLMKRLVEKGATVRDLEPMFAEHAQRSMRSLAVGPYDLHLNNLGIQLAMAAAAEALRP
jgi:hypothetical protein